MKVVKEFGEWQLCPKCYGTGLLQPPYEIRGTAIISGTCDVCNGAKILARPVTEKIIHRMPTSMQIKKHRINKQ